MAACFFQDPAGNKFPLPSCICGYNDFSNIFSEKLGLYYGKLPASLADDYQLHLLGEHGQSRHFPFFILSVIFFRVSQGYKMSKRPGYYIVFAFENTTVLLVCAKNTGNVSGDGWFFRNYK